MEKNPTISRTKKIVYPLILLAIFLILVEGMLSVFLYQKKSPERLASIEALKKLKRALTFRTYKLDVTNHNLVRPDSSQKVNQRIAEEVINSNKFIYESWVEFRNEDFKGHYMNMAGGIRKSSPSAFVSTSSPDTIDVYFLGGSTMFGFNVLDYETIPSQFLQLYAEKFPNGKSMRVHNYGTPTYYSYQELMLLTDLIFRGHRPSLIIFLDGINDFWFATASYYRQSYFSYVFRQVFNQGMRPKGDFKFIDTADNMSKNPTHIEPEQYNATLISNYEQNMENASLMAGLNGSRIHFFCQPSPFYRYPNQQQDPMCFKDTNTRFNDIYPVLEKKADSLSDFSFLANMLENEKNYPFVDGLHYSPGFIRKIAARMLDDVEDKL